MCKIIVNKMIIIMVFFLLCFNVYSETNENLIYYQKKDPFIAGLLSVTMMGLGHFYTKDYLSGSMFVLNDFIQSSLLILLISNFNDKYTDDDTNDKVVEWREINDTDRAIAIGFVAYYFGFKLYCIIDAMASADKYNRNLEKDFTKKNFEVNYLISHDSFSIGFKKNF